MLKRVVGLCFVITLLAGCGAPTAPLPAEPAQEAPERAATVDIIIEVATATATQPPPSPTPKPATVTPSATARPSATTASTATPQPATLAPTATKPLPTKAAPTRAPATTTPIPAVVVPPTAIVVDVPPTPQPPATGGYACPDATRCVKGNINSDGRKLYHFPGCPSYNQTKIDESKGERWFATAAEAVAAGWVKAGNCP